MRSPVPGLSIWLTGLHSARTMAIAGLLVPELTRIGLRAQLLGAKESPAKTDLPLAPPEGTDGPAIASATSSVAKSLALQGIVPVFAVAPVEGRGLDLPPGEGDRFVGVVIEPPSGAGGRPAPADRSGTIRANSAGNRTPNDGRDTGSEALSFLLDTGQGGPSEWAEHVTRKLTARGWFREEPIHPSWEAWCGASA